MHVKKSTDDRVLDIVVYTIITLFIIFIILPVIYLLGSSFVSNQELAAKRVVILPTRPTLSAYAAIFQANRDMLYGYMISIFRVAAGVPLHTFFNFICGYALSRSDMPLKRFFAIFFFFSMMFNAGIIPYYLVVRSMGLFNNPLVYIIPGIIGSGSILLFRNNILSLPPAMLEAAEVDGAGEFTKIFRVAFPLCKAIIITVALFSAVGHWNSWLDSFLFITDSKLRPVQMVLRDILSRSTLALAATGFNQTAMEQLRSSPPPSRAIQSAAVIMVMLPIMLVYPFLQKYFVKGIMVGAVKG